MTVIPPADAFAGANPALETAKAIFLKAAFRDVRGNIAHAIDEPLEAPEALQ